MNNRVLKLFEILAKEKVTPIELETNMKAVDVNSANNIRDFLQGRKYLSTLSLVEIYNTVKLPGLLEMIREEQERYRELLGAEDLDLFNIPQELYLKLLNLTTEDDAEFRSQKIRPLEELHNYFWISIMIETSKQLSTVYKIPSEVDLRKIKKLNTLKGAYLLYKKVMNTSDLELLPDKLIRVCLKGLREELKMQKQEVEAITGIATTMITAYEAGVRKLSPELIEVLRQTFLKRLDDLA